MAHLTRSDIPYHYALANAFTICDAMSQQLERTLDDKQRGAP